MPPKLKLADLVTPHPDLPGKETCLACLTDQEARLEVVEEAKSLKPSQRSKELDAIRGRIKHLWWETDKKQKNGGRYKHFAYCSLTDPSIKSACKKAKEQKDNSGPPPRAGSSSNRSTTSAEPLPTRKSSRAAAPKTQYREESLPVVEDSWEDAEANAEALTKASKKRKAVPVIPDEEEEIEEAEEEDGLDFAEYFAGNRSKRSRRSSVSSSSSLASSAGAQG